jgi:hypothetical protein
VRDPRRTLKEIHRVLHPGGQVAIDAMNELTPLSRQTRGRYVFRYVRKVRSKPAYLEQFNERDFQVRRVCYLRPASSLARFSGRHQVFKTRPRGLSRQTMRVERMYTRYFPEPTLRRMTERAELSVVEIVPLGQMHLLLARKNK